MSESESAKELEIKALPLTNEAAAGLFEADERLFAQLFDISPFPAVVSRLSDHTVIAINQRTSELFGIPQREAAGRLVTDFYVNPSERANLADLVRRNGRADGLRLQIRRPDGSKFWSLFSARLVSYSGQLAVLTVFTDISAQVDAETALRTSEHRLAAQSRALTGLTSRYADPNAPIDERLKDILSVCADTLEVERLSMWRLADDRQTIRCLQLYTRSTGACQSGMALRRQDAPAYFQAIDQERVVAANDARTDPRTCEFAASYLEPHGIGAMLDIPLRQESIAVGVLCAEHVGGSRIWTIDEQNFAISAANLIAVAVADEDRRIALARQAESEARATLVIDTAHDAFIGINSSGHIVTWNTQAETIFGWTRDQIAGKTLTETIIPERFREAHQRGFHHFLKTGEAPVINRRLELAALHASGREFPIEITITSPTRVGEGFYFGAFLRDISERVERDDQLRQAKESAEAATRAKSEFLANMSHELRTPLNGVLGYTQLLQRDKGLNTSQREALDAIIKCGAHLLDLINDVLDLSRIEAGRVEIEPTATDLVQLAIDLRYVMSDAARRKGIALSMSIAPGVPRRVVVDGRHLRQVLLNLIGNAIKFTPEGEVRFEISRTADERLLFEVTDTGIGIEPESQAMIFGAFTQTKSGASAGGTGLGLTISRHLVRSMGDDITVESSLGKGSRFSFALPLVTVKGGAEEEPQGLDLAAPPLDAKLDPSQHITALVVDDSTVSRRILASLLESAGVRVISAAGGLEAIASATEHRPDVIFMDLRMGDLDGFEATRRLHKNPATASIPVVAVTASAFGDTRQAALDAGCLDYLPKPVRAEALFAVLRDHLGAKFVTADHEAANADIQLSPGLKREGLAKRLGDALTIGSVTDLETLAQELSTGVPAEAELGRQISVLAARFDFDGLGQLFEALKRNEPDAAARD